MNGTKLSARERRIIRRMEVCASEGAGQRINEISQGAKSRSEKNGHRAKFPSHQSTRCRLFQAARF